MAVYNVEAKNCSYDEYDSFIVVAENEQEALDFVLKHGNTDNFEVSPTITKVNLTNKGILLGSFNAG